MYIILSPHEYYIVLPAFAINAASKPRLATASTLHTASFILQYVARCGIHNTLLSVLYPLLRCATSTMYNLMIITVLCADEL